MQQLEFQACKRTFRIYEGLPLKGTATFISTTDFGMPTQ